MSLRKAIASGKERCKHYRGAKDFDKSCRNHGGCPYCENGRQHKHKRRAAIVECIEGGEVEMEEETIYEKSERLFRESLVNMTDEEFLEMYYRCEESVGPTIDEFLSWMPINQKDD